MSTDQFAAFRAIVLADRDLQVRLRGTADEATFIALVVMAGSERGYDFSGADVETALRAAQRAWLERWIT